MFPAPVRVETNASLLPSGEYSGRDSVAGCVTSRCASPPAAATVQISPPETNAISRPSGEIAGSLNEGSVVCAIAPVPATETQKTSKQRSKRRRTSDMADTSLQLECLDREILHNLRRLLRRQDRQRVGRKHHRVLGRSYVPTRSHHQRQMCGIFELHPLRPQIAHHGHCPAHHHQPVFLFIEGHLRLPRLPVIQRIRAPPQRNQPAIPLEHLLVSPLMHLVPPQLRSLKRLPVLRIGNLRRIPSKRRKLA